jgi:CRP/FNR family cyclic AMP-dependent transcriptional regulator
MLQKRACELTAEDCAEIIRQSEFGHCLSEDLLARLAATSFAIDYRRRRFIYRANDTADALYLIARGRVKLCRIEETTDREAVIDILSAGSLFGESALFALEPLREKCAVAYENSRLLRIPVGDFKTGMAENRELYDYTFRLIGQRLTRAERLVANFALDAIPARLEKLLLEFSKRYGVRETNGVLIDISLPHREIASIVGSTRESVTVRLNAMRRDGIIDFVNRKILIKRPESLAVA